MTKKLSEVLLSKDLLSAEALDALWRSPALRGKSFALRLYQSGLVSADQLHAELLGLGARDATEQIASLPPARVLALVPSRLAESGSLVPFMRSGNRLHVAMLDPSNDRAIEDLSLFSGLAVEPYLAHARSLFRALFEAYAIPVPSQLANFDPASALDTEVLPPPRGVTLPPIHTAPGSAPSSPSDADLEWEDPPHSGITLSVFGAIGRSPLEQSLRDLELEPSVSDMRSGVQTEPDLEPGSPPQSTVERGAIPGWNRPEALPERVPGWRLAQLAANDQAQRRTPSVQAAMSHLQTHFHNIVVLFVQGDLAVGWDAQGPAVSRDRVRDVLLPLSSPSTLRRALLGRACALAEPSAAESTDRLLLSFVGNPGPKCWAVAPVLIEGQVQAFLYADSQDSQLSAVQVGALEQVAVTLGEQLSGAEI